MNIFNSKSKKKQDSCQGQGFFKNPKSLMSISLIFIVFFGVLKVYSFFDSKGDDQLGLDSVENIVTFQGNTLVPLSNPANPPLKTVGKLPVIITAYSSTPGQTDDTPFVTAAGTLVKDGIVANNYLPFGTKIRIPELYDDKVFVVEDRMSWKKGNYHVDIWFPEYSEALAFGAKRTYIEIVDR